jgi:hypothetical protein
VKIDSTDTLDEVATCQDGSEWVLFWLENEIAFVRPGSHQLYRWRRDVYNLYPYLYSIEKGESGLPRKSEPGEQAPSFAILLEALNRHRGKGQQKVTVERRI